MTDALTAIAVGVALFAVLLLLNASTTATVGIPAGIAAVWFLAQTARRSRRGRDRSE